MSVVILQVYYRRILPVLVFLFHLQKKLRSILTFSCQPFMVVLAQVLLGV